jgi:hypothetical protein
MNRQSKKPALKETQYKFSMSPLQAGKWAIRELIDQVKTDSPKQIGAEMKAVLSLLPGANKADFVVTLNALRLFNTATSMVPIPIPSMDIQAESNIVIAGRAANGRMVVNVAMPKQHLIEIMSAFMMMQQKTSQ